MHGSGYVGIDLHQNSIARGTLAYADSNMVHTMLMLRNLISNAMKFTPAGGEIEVSAKSIDEQLLEIAVSETGAGIPPEDLAKLFRIDIRYTHVGTGGEKGTGLGLNLCKDLVEKTAGTSG